MKNNRSRRTVWWIVGLVAVTGIGLCLCFWLVPFYASGQMREFTTSSDYVVPTSFLAWLGFPLAVGVSVYLGVARRKREIEAQNLQKDVDSLKRDAVPGLRNDWLDSLAATEYRSEIEVEIKLIAPLLRYLGYDGSSFSVRVPVQVQMGRKKARGEADWVIWDKASSNSSRKARAIIEAKGPGQALTEVVQGQARSYAYGLNAPLYLLVNGRMIAVYRRGVQSDYCLFESNITDLQECWHELEETIGVNAKTHIQKAG